MTMDNGSNDTSNTVSWITVQNQLFEIKGILNTLVTEGIGLRLGPLFCGLSI